MTHDAIAAAIGKWCEARHLFDRTKAKLAEAEAEAKLADAKAEAKAKAEAFAKGAGEFAMGVQFVARMVAMPQPSPKLRAALAVVRAEAPALAAECVALAEQARAAGLAEQGAFQHGATAWGDLATAAERAAVAERKPDVRAAWHWPAEALAVEARLLLGRLGVPRLGDVAPEPVLSLVAAALGWAGIAAPTPERLAERLRDGT